jgi:hypothetical protein
MWNILKLSMCGRVAVDELKDTWIKASDLWIKARLKNRDQLWAASQQDQLARSEN